jgi:hypothetical protein
MKSNIKRTQTQRRQPISMANPSDHPATNNSGHPVSSHPANINNSDHPVSGYPANINNSDHPVSGQPAINNSDHPVSGQPASHRLDHPSSGQPADTQLDLDINQSVRTVLPTNRVPSPTPPTDSHHSPCLQQSQTQLTQRGIHAAVYAASLPNTQSSLINTPVAEITGNVTSHQQINNILANPLAYVITSTVENKSPHDSTACNNSEDILTQSQMFKADDHQLFIDSQQAEIENLVKSDVMAVILFKTSQLRQSSSVQYGATVKNSYQRRPIKT